MKTIVKVTTVVVISIALFVGVALLIREYLLPSLSQPWQTDVIWVIGAAIATITFLAGLAEFTGYNVKTLFSRSEPKINTVPPEQDNRGAISLNTSDHGKIDWDGDILQSGSTKIVVPDRNVVESQKNIEPSSLELINEIQSELYGNNSGLPHVLTLCLDLCDRVSLVETYERWLRAELSGYPLESVKFYSEFSNVVDGDAWLDEWASHRFIETYVKLIEPGQSIVRNVSFKRIFIAYPVSEIARMIDRSRASDSQEFNVSWSSVAPDHYASMVSYFAENVPGARLPSDLRIFFSLTALEKLLDDVRARALSLLGNARQRIRQDKVLEQADTPDAEKLKQLKELAGELAERVGSFGPIENEYNELSLKISDLKKAAGRFRHYPRLAESIRDMHNTVSWIMHNQRRFESRQEHDEVMHELEERYWNLIQAINEWTG